MLTTEAKVGAMTLAAITLLAGMLIGLSHFNFGEKGYPVYAMFHDVSGLVPGNLVRYSGVEVGRVEAVNIIPSGIKVVMRLNKGTVIPQDSHFTLGSDGLLGEKFITITPPEKASGAILASGDTVQGEDPQGFATLIASADRVLADVHTLVQSLNDIVGDDQVKASLKESAINARLITENINVLTASMARMAVNNEQNVGAIVENLKSMSESLKLVSARVDKMAAAVDNNGQTAMDLTAAVHNISLASGRIERMAQSLEGVVTDPKTAQNLKETLQNVHDASAKANQLLGKFSGIKAGGDMTAFYNPNRGKYRIDADFRLGFSPQNFALVGVDNIGESDKFNFQIGSQRGGFSQRAGIISGKAGVGFDTKLGNQLRFSVDVYDPNSVKVKLRSEYKLSDDLSLVGQSDSINRQASQSTYFGLAHSF